MTISDKWVAEEDLLLAGPLYEIQNLKFFLERKKSQDHCGFSHKCRDDYTPYGVCTENGKCRWCKESLPSDLWLSDELTYYFALHKIVLRN